MKRTLSFINAFEELPKKSGEYLCYIDGEWIVLEYSAKHRLFNAFDHWSYEDAYKGNIKVTYWAKLPEM